jgi:hypothetical protein
LRTTTAKKKVALGADMVAQLAERHFCIPFSGIASGEVMVGLWSTMTIIGWVASGLATHVPAAAGSEILSPADKGAEHCQRYWAKCQLMQHRCYWRSSYHKANTVCHVAFLEQS